MKNMMSCIRRNKPVVFENLEEKRFDALKRNI